MRAPRIGGREGCADRRRGASPLRPTVAEGIAAAASPVLARTRGDIRARSRDSLVRMPTNDANLVARARAGDADAYAALLRRHQPALARVCTRMLGDPA